MKELFGNDIKKLPPTIQKLISGKSYTVDVTGCPRERTLDELF
jgi:hypothetical protein